MNTTSLPSSGQVIDDDPMMRVLHERHPDVDIVMLSAPLPVTVPPPMLPDSDAEERLELEEEIDALVALIESRLACHTAWPNGVSHQAHWQYGDRVGGRQRSVRREVVIVANSRAPGDTVRLLRAVTDVLIDLGWQVCPMPGHLPRLSAQRDSFTATVMAHHDSLRVSLSSERMIVCDEQVSPW